jgi:hypothetical protein
MLAQDSDCSGLDDIGKQLDALAQESPNIPKVVHKAMAGYVHAGNVRVTNGV